MPTHKRNLIRFLFIFNLVILNFGDFFPKNLAESVEFTLEKSCPKFSQFFGWNRIEGPIIIPFSSSGNKHHNNTSASLMVIKLFWISRLFSKIPSNGVKSYKNPNQKNHVESSRNLGNLQNKSDGVWWPSCEGNILHFSNATLSLSLSLHYFDVHDWDSWKCLKFLHG